MWDADTLDAIARVVRMAILELKAARGWSNAETARRLLLEDPDMECFTEVEQLARHPRQTPKPILKKLREGTLSKMAALALVALDEKARREVMLRLTEIGGEATEATVKLLANEIAVPEEPAEPKARARGKATKKGRGRANRKVAVRRPKREINKAVEKALAKAGHGSKGAFHQGVAAGLMFSIGLVGWREVSPTSAKLKKALTQSGGKTRAT